MCKLDDMANPQISCRTNFLGVHILCDMMLQTFEKETLLSKQENAVYPNKEVLLSNKDTLPSKQGNASI